MNPVALIKKTLWLSLLSWMLSGKAEARCVHESTPGLDGLFHLPPLGDLFVFGLAVLLMWGLSVWLMDRILPQSKSGSRAGVDPVHEVQNFELSGIQSKTDKALSWIQTEYEQMILDRLHEMDDKPKSQAGTQEYRGQRAASV